MLMCSRTSTHTRARRRLYRSICSSRLIADRRGIRRRVTPNKPSLVQRRRRTRLLTPARVSSHPDVAAQQVMSTKPAVVAASPVAPHGDSAITSSSRASAGNNDNDEFTTVASVFGDNHHSGSSGVSFERRLTSSSASLADASSSSASSSHGGRGAPSLTANLQQQHHSSSSQSPSSTSSHYDATVVGGGRPSSSHRSSSQLRQSSPLTVSEQTEARYRARVESELARAFPATVVRFTGAVEDWQHWSLTVDSVLDSMDVLFTITAEVAGVQTHSRGVDIDPTTDHDRRSMTRLTVAHPSSAEYEYRILASKRVFAWLLQCLHSAHDRRLASSSPLGNPYRLMRILRRQYEGHVTHHSLDHLLEQLEQMKQSESENITGFINRIVTVTIQLQAHSHPVADTTLVRIFLRGVLPAFQDVVSHCQNSLVEPSFNDCQVVLQRAQDRQFGFFHVPSSGQSPSPASSPSSSVAQHSSEGAHAASVQRVCEHCKKTGHTKAICYKIVGYPPRSAAAAKASGAGANSAVVTSAPQPSAFPPAPSPISNAALITPASSLTFVHGYPARIDVSQPSSSRSSRRRSSKRASASHRFKLDSAASTHLISSAVTLHHSSPTDIRVIGLDGRAHHSPLSAIGNICLPTVGGSGFVLRNVIQHPDFSVNLISLSQLTREGCTFAGDAKGLTVSRKGVTLFFGRRLNDDTFEVDLHPRHFMQRMASNLKCPVVQAAHVRIARVRPAIASIVAHVPIPPTTPLALTPLNSIVSSVARPSSYRAALMSSSSHRAHAVAASPVVAAATAVQSSSLGRIYVRLPTVLAPWR